MYAQCLKCAFDCLNLNFEFGFIENNIMTSAAPDLGLMDYLFQEDPLLKGGLKDDALIDENYINDPIVVNIFFFFLLIHQIILNSPKKNF